MSTTATEPRTVPGAPAPRRIPAADRHPVTFASVVRSEWIKFRTVRSSIITVLASLVVVVGFALLGAFTFDAAPAQGPGPGGPGFSDPVAIALGGVTLAQLIIGVLGALVVTNEYGNGMVRATMSAVPRRTPVLLAKVVVVGGVTLVVSLVAAFAAFFASQAVLSGNGDPTLGLGDDDVLRTVVGAAVYLTGVSVIGTILGTLLRSTAAAIATLFGLVFLFPTLIGLVLPDSWNDAITGYLPSNAGNSFMTLDPSGTSLSPWAGLAVFAAWIVVGLACAAVRLRRRDV